MDQKTTEFYKRLHDELANTSLWPAPYLFKFIVPTDQDKINAVENAFNNLGAVIEKNPSKTGKYTSVSIHVKMKNPDQVIEKYQEVSDIEGIISL